MGIESFKHSQESKEREDGEVFQAYMEDLRLAPEEFALYHFSLIVDESHKYAGDDFDPVRSRARTRGAREMCL